jgi:hypothetical protein
MLALTRKKMVGKPQRQGSSQRMMGLASSATSVTSANTK